MKRHVDHLIIAYVNDQLSPRRTSRVLQHIQRCSRCRGLVANHEQITRDLTLTLVSTPQPVSLGWNTIAARLNQPIRPRLRNRFVAGITTLFILTSPLLLFQDGLRAGQVAGQTSTIAPPPVKTAHAPQSALWVTHNTIEFTPEPDPESMPVMPVPPAPLTSTVGQDQ